jgi:hypothetical protein
MSDDEAEIFTAVLIGRGSLIPERVSILFSEQCAPSRPVRAGRGENSDGHELHCRGFPRHAQRRGIGFVGLTGLSSSPIESNH